VLGRGGARKRREVFAVQAETEQSGFCDDEMKDGDIVLFRFNV